MDTITKKVPKDKKGREEDAKKIQEIECRYYENKYPHIDDLVMVFFNSNKFYFKIFIKKIKIKKNKKFQFIFY